MRNPGRAPRREVRGRGELSAGQERGLQVLVAPLDPALVFGVAGRRELDPGGPGCRRTPRPARSPARSRRSRCRSTASRSQTSVLHAVVVNGRACLLALPARLLPEHRPPAVARGDPPRGPVRHCLTGGAGLVGKEPVPELRRSPAPATGRACAARGASSDSAFVTPGLAPASTAARRIQCCRHVSLIPDTTVQISPVPTADPLFRMVGMRTSIIEGPRPRHHDRHAARPSDDDYTLICEEPG